MANIILNRKVVEKLTKTNLDKIKDKVTMLGTSLEDLNDNELVIEVLPNRPDLLSEQGFSRALNLFLGNTKGLKEYKVKKSDYKVIVDKSVSNLRPYTAFFLVKNIKLDNNKIIELINIQEKLHLTFCRNRKKASIGMYPSEKITLPIHYKLLPKEKIYFQPLESDKKMNIEEIFTKHPAGRKYANLLNNLNSYPVFLDSKNNILSLVPIINSHDTGKITEETKEFFVECTSVDINTVNLLSNILSTTFIDMGAEVYSMEINYPDKKLITPELKTHEMQINLDNVNKLLGVNINEQELKKCLEKLGYNYNNKKVTIPCYRTDIISEVDLIEDVAIGYGYENFDPEIPNLSTIGSEDKFNYFKDKIANVLTGLNLLECSSFVISNSSNQNSKMLLNNEIILLENSLNQDYDALRSWIIPNLLKILSENQHNEYPQNIFEIGKIFKKGESETNVIEQERVAIVLCHNKADFTQIKQVLDALFSILNLKYEIKDVKHESFIPGRVGRITINNKKVAFIGEIYPQVLKNFKLEMPCACLELNLTELFELI